MFWGIVWCVMKDIVKLRLCFRVCVLYIPAHDWVWLYNAGSIAAGGVSFGHLGKAVLTCFAGASVFCGCGWPAPFFDVGGRTRATAHLRQYDFAAGFDNHVQAVGNRGEGFGVSSLSTDAGVPAKEIRPPVSAD